MNNIELQVMNHLVEAYNNFLKLDSQHPNELSDFVEGIHKCQYVLAMRVARKYEPDVFIKSEVD